MTTRGLISSHTHHTRQSYVKISFILIAVVIAMTSLVDAIQPTSSSTSQQHKIDPTNNLNQRINEIIAHHHKELISDPIVQEYLERNKHKLDNPDYDRKKADGHYGYNCIHDQIIKHQQDMINDHKQQQQQQEQHYEKEEEVEGVKHLIGEQLGTSKLLEQTNALTPIRVKFDLSYINNQTNDAYACKNLNDKVSIGNTNSNSPNCSPNIDPNTPCFFICSQQDDLQTGAVQTLLINSVVKSLGTIIQEFVSVNQVGVKFANGYPSSCYYGVPIPTSFYTTTAYDYDIYVWVTARPAPSRDTIAYALSCNYLMSNKGIQSRPIGALINFNPYYFQPSLLQNLFEFNEFVRVGVHEMTHALGFAPNLYQFFVNSNGDAYGPTGYADISGKSPSGSSFQYRKTYIISPTVVSYGQAHYGCSGLEGVELEDSGSSGTAGAHWEKRMAGEEYMIGYVQGIQPITNLTLSLLLDTGWYGINATGAEPFIWGRNLGCSWAVDECSANTWNYQGYWCEENKRGCSATRMGKASCGFYQYASNLPPKYQHFDDPSLGGDYYTDACTYYRVPSTFDSNYHYCVDTAYQPSSSAIFEKYGPASRCFEYAGGIACWEFKCVNQTVFVKVGSQYANCTVPGSTVTVSGVDVICPMGFAECGATPIPVDISPASITSIISVMSIIVILLSSILNMF